MSWHRRPSLDLYQSTRLQNRTPSEAGLYVQSLHPVQSSLGTSQTLTRGSRTFLKMGIKQPICPSVCVAGGGEGLSGIHLQSSWGTSCSRAQGPSEKAAAARGSASCPASTSPSLSPLLSAPSAHTVLPGGRRMGGSDRSTPGFCVLGPQLGTRRAEEATALRAPGQRREPRERTGLGESILAWELSGSSRHSARPHGSAGCPQTWSSGSGSRRSSPLHSNQTCWGKSHRSRIAALLGRTGRRHDCA